MPRYAMVIDLQRCVGCGSCSLACRNENNVSDGTYWSSKISQTAGTFPNVRYHYLPTLCNHCQNAPCVRSCPTRAMHKLPNGITMHDPGKCIGCKYCMISCPYGAISFNWESPHRFWRDQKELIPGCTSSPAGEVRAVGGKGTPYYNPARSATTWGVREKGVVEKCTLCDHRLVRGLLPYCVEACPADARIFGDILDPKGEVSRLLGKYRPFRLREDVGTEPHVFYIRGFNSAPYQATKGAL